MSNLTMREAMIAVAHGQNVQVYSVENDEWIDIRRDQAVYRFYKDNKYRLKPEKVMIKVALYKKYDNIVGVKEGNNIGDGWKRVSDFVSIEVKE